MANLKQVLADIFGHGNEGCILPGQFEAEARKRSDEAGGLHFTEAELKEFNELAAEIGEAGLTVI
jgi:L-2-hydroxycarboxylate dehydrogenase (NAD+)